MNSTQNLKLVLATRNSDKIREIREVLTGLAIDILTVDRFPQVPEVIEDGHTLEENAIKKAKTIAEATDLLALADDTGLEVNFLGGQPGIYSSRYAGNGASYDDNVNKLLAQMKGVSWDKRTARFRCVIAIIGPKVEKIVAGVCEGIIAHEKRGTNGFGYDPIFYVPGYDQTFAEMSLDVKNKISHRGLALKQARKILLELLEIEKVKKILHFNSENTILRGRE